MGLSKIWLSLKHCLSQILYSHSAALLHTLVLYRGFMGLGEAAYSVKHVGKQEDCSVLLLLRTAAQQRVNIIAHEPFHLQQEVKACDYTQQVITEHPAGNLLPFQRERSKPTRGGGEERCSQPLHEINVGPNLRSFLRGRERYGQKNHRAPSAPDYLCAGGLILHTKINGRFATNFNGSRNKSYHLEVYWLSAESFKIYTEITQRII